MNDFSDAVPQEIQDRLDKAIDDSADTMAVFCMTFAQATLYEYNAWLVEKAKEQNCPSFTGVALVEQFIDEEMEIITNDVG